MPTNTPPGATSASPTVPQQIGHYQVIAKIGVGGMGEVYRARDPRLNRDVAIKVLPRAFAEDPHRMARFQREAQLLASLNHAKIAAIYGLEESGPTRALVMELVEGPTLAERIGRTTPSGRSKAGSASPAQTAGSAAPGSGGNAAARSGSAGATRPPAIPLEDALPIAAQVAEALEYAHEHGVVHRDLKPANIKVTPDGGVKVLDFGLAKAMAPEEGSGDNSNSPTLSLAMTEAGLILGTAAYMAPEQAKGRQVDRRADIWAFGCVLYEMLCGRKAFEGETVSDILASVIKSEPDWSALPADTPPATQRLLRRCLQKDPKQRLRDIGEARIAIEETLSGEGAATEAISVGRAPESRRISPLRRALPWALGATTILLAAFAAWLLLQPRPPHKIVRFPVRQPENTLFVYAGMPAVSPDGRTLAFLAQPGPSKPQVLWLRPLDSLTAQPIAGTDNAYLPFWSPDSQWIGFYANGKLEKVATSGGSPQTLCDTAGALGATWNRDGVILFADRDGLHRVPDTGGATTVITANPPGQKAAYGYPQFLPDSRRFLLAVRRPGLPTTFLGTGSLDSKTVQHLAEINLQAYYAAPGYLFYLDQSTLMARPFNARALRFTGPAVPVAQSVGSDGSVAYGYFSVSPAGVLAYMAGSNAVQNTPGQMAWFSRAGEKLSAVGEPEIVSTPALSPDGTKVAVTVGEYQKHAIWIYDLKRGAASRLTFNPADDENPVWSRDGSTIYFSSNRSGWYGTYRKAADGLGSTQPVSSSKDQPESINDLSPDGRYAIYDTMAGNGGNQLWGMPLFGDRKHFAFVQGSFSAGDAQFSPNGRYLAYITNETGRQEVYVQTFPQHTGKWQISVSGGTEPMWSRNGKELFYLAPGDNGSETKLMAAAVDTDSAAFQAGIPKTLFQTQLIPLWYWKNIYAPSPDGQRFLMIVPAGQVKQQPITVVVNWPALLKK